MKKIFSLVTICILLLILIVNFSACKKIEINPIELDYGHYEMRYDAEYQLMSLNSNIINDDNKSLAMEHILCVADTNLQNAPYISKITFAEGEAYTGGIGGKMIMRMLMLKHNNAFYYEAAGSLYEANPAAGLQAGKIFIDQASREYSADMETFYKQNPKYKGKPTMTDDFPYFSIDYRKAKLETMTMDEREDKDYFGKLTNFVFNSNTVKHDSIAINYIEADGLYTLSFELNLEDEAARQEATQVPRDKLREQGSEDLEYVYYKYTMEIWDNGLIRTVTAEESWLGTIDVFFLHLNGSSESVAKDYYSWDPSDSAHIESLDTSWAA